MTICCGSYFSSEENLLKHLSSASHFTGTSCPRCRMRFQTRRLLAGHLLDFIHLPPRPLSQFTCNRCSRPCVDQKHFVYDQGLQHFRCDLCYSDPASEENSAPARQAPQSLAPPLQPREVQHAISHQSERRSPRPFRCDPCNRQFNSHHALAQHRSAIHARNPIPGPVARATEIPDAPRYTCKACRRTFVNQYALDQHSVSNAHPENIVSQRPRYMCSECGALFRTRDLLILHAAEHVHQRQRRRR
ncbi:hypothetical protein Q9L58_007833 [Maublancomyces gigas]|uniref:C2H2-type domain-containing protein n=1 Tax=Discina gigas TaxID=1032678 RepID=A0ABR3GBZ0_9PEZI